MKTGKVLKTAACVLALTIVVGTACSAEAGVVSGKLRGIRWLGGVAAEWVDDVYRWGGKLWRWGGDAAKGTAKAGSTAMKTTRTASAGSKLARVVGALSDAQIDDLAKLSIPALKKALGKMKLSAEVLADTFLRLLVKRELIIPCYADELWKNLKNVDGFVSTMAKACSSNIAQQIGHMFELNLANQAAKKGFSVLGIGKKFKDAAKKGLTDLDVLLEKAGKKIFIEAKNYADVQWEHLATFRADMDSLIEAKKLMGDGRMCFVISNKPTNPKIMQALNEAARQRGVELFFGNAESVIKSL